MGWRGDYFRFEARRGELEWRELFSRFGARRGGLRRRERAISSFGTIL